MVPLTPVRVDVPLKPKANVTKLSTEAASLSFTLQQSNPDSELMDLGESDSDDSDDSVKLPPPQPQQQPINQDHIGDDEDDSLSSSSLDSPIGESGRRYQDDTDNDED